MMGNAPLDVKGLSVAVVGAGMTGQAVAAGLLALGARPWIADTRAESDLAPEALSAIAALGCPARFADSTGMAEADLVVLSPGVSVRDPFLESARASGVEVIGEIELAARLRPDARIIGITGTNGKSTTTALTAAILEEAGLPCALCGNIGSPLITHVLERKDDPWFVTELSSFQLETVSQLRTRAAAIMNISDDHRDRHPSPAEYAAAKARILANQTDEDAAVLGADSPPLSALALSIPEHRLLRFSAIRAMPAGGYVRESTLWFRPRGGEEEMICRLDEMRLQGVHNILNALAATCLASCVGAPTSTAARVIRRFQAASHTFRAVGASRGALYINDSKGTNVDSTIQALRSCSGPLILIAGGSNKNADFAPLIEEIARRCRAVLAIGQTGPSLAEGARSVGVEIVEECSSLEGAVERAQEIAEPGTTVLLSPACASFDMFRSYKHRGEVFEEAVRGLPGFTPAAEG